MLEKNFNILIEGYLNNTLSPQELETFFELVLSGEYDNVLSENFLFGLQESKDLKSGLPHDVSDTIIRNIMSSESFAKNTIKRSASVKKLTQYLVAASVVLILISSYFLKSILLGDTETLPNGMSKSNCHFKENITKNPISIILDDSSTVILQPTAKLYYSVKQYNKREVYLEGNAFFSVTKNKVAPFYVYSGAIVTKVLGTSFTITNTPNGNTEVLVKSGRVQVYENNKKTKELRNSYQPAILQPNHKAIYHTKNENIELTLADKPELVKETNGYTSVDSSSIKFVFIKSRLKNVLKQLETHYGIEIILSNEDLYTSYFTGDITEQDLYTKLKIICLATNTNYEVNGTKILITGAGLKK